ncbi:MAG: hypothetical protein Q7T20_04945 [Saprospiraceae bacterium]|nr:hypothetical protein [Saprospiraceae bacterium]
MRPFQILLLAYLLLAAGCVQYHYSPNFVQTPYGVKKGSGQVNASVGGSPVALNGDFHASYSPIKHGTVMLNYFRTRSSFEDTNFFTGPTYTHTSKGYLLEAAAGGYMPIAFGTGAMYVGWGQGKMRNDYGIERIADLRLQRFFVQPTFTFKNDWFRLGMGLRLVRLNFPSGSIDYRIEPADIEIIQRLERESPFWFPEFGGNIGVHFKPFTISASLVIVGTKPAFLYGFDGSNIGLGISYELE